MRLRSFQVENYRSIHSTPSLEIGRSLTLIGPNNEGKSNIVRAIVTSLEILKWHASSILASRSITLARARSSVSRRSKLIYVWDQDFPKDLQAKRGGATVFRLVFELTDEDRAQFRGNYILYLATVLRHRLLNREASHEYHRPHLSRRSQGAGAYRSFALA